MASLIRRHPMLAAVATAFVCSPIWLPLLLITSPFLLFTSLFSMGLMTLVKCLFYLGFRLQKSLSRERNRKRLGMQYAGVQGHGNLEDVCRKEEAILIDNRVQEYLEDQLKNLNVVALGRSGSAEDLLPCSFSFGSDDFMETFSYGLLTCHDKA